MIKHGIAPYLECSARGDKRFSAFYAKVNGKSIEEQYQAAKQFKINDNIVSGLKWIDAKGKKPLNIAEVKNIYANLWDDYIASNPELLDILRNASGLSDIYGQKGHACQATELWRIRNSGIRK